MYKSVTLDSSTLEDYIRERIETGTAKVSTFLGNKIIRDDETGDLINKNIEIITFPLEAEITFIDNFGIPFQYGEDDLAVIYEDTVNLMYIGNAIYLNDAEKALKETFKLIGERLGYTNEELSEFMFKMCKNYMQSYEVSALDAKILRSVLELEAIELLMANVNGKIYAYVYKEEQERVKSLVEQIREMDAKEKENPEKCIEEITRNDDHGLALEEVNGLDELKKEINTDKNFELKINSKNNKTALRNQAEIDAHIRYLKERADGIYAMTDEELLGLQGEMANNIKYFILDNSLVRDQIYEENLSELQNVYNEVYLECQERGIYLDDSGPMDVASRLDVNEPVADERPMKETVRSWQEKDDYEINEYEERTLFY